jgi:hypothetical protein|nr:DUF4124 domain-containing protein [Pseudoalteromonas sp. 1CM17D]|tara:strand:- start:1440 stop:1967 length:528 start_codon:yes stop_codon:yes gene_type:complete
MQGSNVNYRILLLFFALGLSIYSYAGNKKIYAWKDKNGVLVFSDTPRSGAHEIKLSSQDLTLSETDKHPPGSPQPTHPNRFQIMISSPTHNQTVRENTGSVYVTSRITPRFEAGFTIQLFLNGNAYGPASDLSTFAIRDVENGAHTLYLKLYNKQNQAIAISQPSTFVMQRKAVN